jgi:hypothetical protein
VPDVLKAKVDALLHEAIADDFVDNNTDCGGSNIVDDASSSVEIQIS